MRQQHHGDDGDDGESEVENGGLQLELQLGDKVEKERA